MRLSNKAWNLTMALPGHRMEREVSNDPKLLERDGPPALKAVFDKWAEERGPLEVVRRLRNAAYAG